MTDEEWRDIPGWEDSYQASSHGRIRSLDRHLSRGRWGHVTRRGGVLSPVADRRGYLKVGLRGPKGRKYYGVHRLVCMAFHGLPPTSLHVAAHFPDPKPSNNRPDNLMWATPAENTAHREVHGTSAHGERNHFALLTEADVLEIRQLYRRGRPCHPGNHEELAARFGICGEQVKAIANGRAWAHLRAQSPA